MLTDTQTRNAKPEAKLYKLRDGAGLYLEVTPAGGKHWRYRFELQGKEDTNLIQDKRFGECSCNMRTLGLLPMSRTNGLQQKQTYLNSRGLVIL